MRAASERSENRGVKRKRDKDDRGSDAPVRVLRSCETVYGGEPVFRTSVHHPFCNVRSTRDVQPCYELHASELEDIQCIETILQMRNFRPHDNVSHY